MKVNYTNKKYNILKILHHNYSKVEAARKRQQIIDTLHVGERTLISWLYMTKDKQTEIRYSYLVKIAKILNVEVGELINYQIV